MKRLSKLRCGVAAIAATLVAGTALAAPVFFTDETNFSTALGGAALNTEGFTGQTGTGLTSLNLSGFTVSTSDSFNVSTSSTYCGTGAPCLNFTTQTGGTDITFTFSPGINAFALDIFDAGTTGGTDIILTTSTGSQTVFDDFAINTRGGALFAGVIDTMNTFATVTFRNTDPGDIVGLDNIQFGTVNTPAVPLPASAVLLGLGLAGFGVMRRRQKA